MRPHIKATGGLNKTGFWVESPPVFSSFFRIEVRRVFARPHPYFLTVDVVGVAFVGAEAGVVVGIAERSDGLIGENEIVG